ncbi:MAG: hypothetical protein O9301_04615 [Leptospira sp.]|nr:hypothetical protein [Leptospira sp.]
MNDRVQRRKFLILFLIFSSFTLVSCGLFHKGVPKAGEFCYLIKKPYECLFVDFQKEELVYAESNIKLIPQKQRLLYQFVYASNVYELSISTENRVDIRNTKDPNDFKFYMRKKDKFREKTGGSE